MRALDIIAAKRDGREHSPDELEFLMRGYLRGEIPDYQMSAWLMAVYLNGMTEAETVLLTKIMLESGEQMDLSGYQRPTVDKHSTGGVGDKISLVLGPVLAAAGFVVGKLSGRGLGHTGGTIDKLESIPGFTADLNRSQFDDLLKTVGIALIGAGPTLAPADKKLYALRDVTATVGCLPLIASSIMSKKLAGGAEHIVLDVKTGRGAFLPDPDQARQLARLMIAIGKSFDRKVTAVLSNMDQPLGLAIGNSLEVKEAIAVLRGQGPADVRELTIALGAELALSTGFMSTHAAATELLGQLIDSGKAWSKFSEFVSGQGGDSSAVENPELLPEARFKMAIRAETSGYIHDIDALTVGRCAMLTGAGRERKEDCIDYSAGIALRCQCGSEVRTGQKIAVLHGNDLCRLQEVAPQLQYAFIIKTDRPAPKPLLIDIVH